MTKDEEAIALQNIAALVRAGRVFVVVPTESGEDDAQKVDINFAPIFERAALRISTTAGEA